MKIDSPTTWPAQELLRPVHTVNEQCFALLVHIAQALTAPPRGFALADRMREPLRQWEASARQRAARHPVLLVDLHFRDAEWWRQARRTTLSTSLDVRRIDAGTRNRMVMLARAAVVVAWHMCRADRESARLFLAVTDTTADLISELSPLELPSFAERNASELSVRWGQQLSFWRELIRASREKSVERERQVRVHSLQLVGAARIRRPA